MTYTEEEQIRREIQAGLLGGQLANQLPPYATIVRLEHKGQTLPTYATKITELSELQRIYEKFAETNEEYQGGLIKGWLALYDGNSKRTDIKPEQLETAEVYRQGTRDESQGIVATATPAENKAASLLMLECLLNILPDIRMVATPNKPYVATFAFEIKTASAGTFDARVSQLLFKLTGDRYRQCYSSNIASGWVVFVDAKDVENPSAGDLDRLPPLRELPSSGTELELLVDTGKLSL